MQTNKTNTHSPSSTPPPRSSINSFGGPVLRRSRILHHPYTPPQMSKNATTPTTTPAMTVPLFEERLVRVWKVRSMSSLRDCLGRVSRERPIMVSRERSVRVSGERFVRVCVESASRGVFIVKLSADMRLLRDMNLGGDMRPGGGRGRDEVDEAPMERGRERGIGQRTVKPPRHQVLLPHPTIERSNEDVIQEVAQRGSEGKVVKQANPTTVKTAGSKVL